MTESIVNVSQLDHPVDAADFAEDPQQPPLLEAALARVGLSMRELLKQGTLRSCLKPNIVTASGVRKVDIQAIRVSETDIVALPGKATQAPLLADRVSGLLGLDSETTSAKMIRA